MYEHYCPPFNLFFSFFFFCLFVLTHQEVATLYPGCLPQSSVPAFHIPCFQTSKIAYFSSSGLESHTGSDLQQVSQRVINFKNVTFDFSDPKSPPKDEKWQRPTGTWQTYDINWVSPKDSWPLGSHDESDRARASKGNLLGFQNVSLWSIQQREICFPE